MFIGLQTRSLGLKRWGIALLLCVIVAGLVPQHADAWAYSGTSKRIGSVVPPTIYIADLLMPSGYTAFTLYGDTGPAVYRSPASTGAQIVKAQYIVQMWDGSKWVNSAVTQVFTGQIAANQTSYRFPAPYVQPSVARGTFRFTWAFDWLTTSGTLLGSTYVISDRTSDHVCVTRSRLCQSYVGSFRTGGYLTGAW